MTTGIVSSTPKPAAPDEPRRFEPGTLGWTAADLDDPAIEREWLKGSYEIVEGVLTKIPPAYFAGGNAAFNLMVLLKAYSTARGLDYRLAPEGEIVIDPVRLPRADAVLLTPEDQRRQDEAVRLTGRPDPKRTRILVPPTLIIESVSPGHELHDVQTKRTWYAEFGVPNYWIVDAYRQTLECLRLDAAGNYVTDAHGTGDDVINPTAFPGLMINLRELWNG
ncbi:MAG TPA: Uma2 family endonuclease [Tepidisphaeraceae bacterium]|jgi:Uma2 family endonuclease